MENRKEGYIK